MINEFDGEGKNIHVSSIVRGRVNISLQNGVKENLESVRKEDERLVVYREADGFFELRPSKMIEKDMV